MNEVSLVLTEDGSATTKHAHLEAGWTLHIRSPEGETVHEDWGPVLHDPLHADFQGAAHYTNNLPPSSFFLLRSSLSPCPPRRLAAAFSLTRTTLISIYGVDYSGPPILDQVHPLFPVALIWIKAPRRKVSMVALGNKRADQLAEKRRQYFPPP